MELLKTAAEVLTAVLLQFTPASFANQRDTQEAAAGARSAATGETYTHGNVTQFPALGITKVDEPPLFGTPGLVELETFDGAINRVSDSFQPDRLQSAGRIYPTDEGAALARVAGAKAETGSLRLIISHLQAPRITSLQISSSNLVLSFNTVSGNLYRVERIDGIADSFWTAVADGIPGTGGILQVIDDGGAGKLSRFYRVVQLGGVGSGLLVVPEGGSSLFTVRLSGQPTNDVSVTTARTSGDVDLSVSGGATLTFTTNNWAVPQMVTVAAAEDADAANGQALLTLTPTGGLAGQTLTATELDNDTQGLIVSTNQLSVPELGTNFFTARLNAQPTNNVSVTTTRTGGDTNLFITNGLTLSFTTNNWNVPQKVVIAAAEDSDAVNGSATFTVAAADLTNQIVTVTETDNDLGGVISFGAASYTVTETGPNATITLNRSGGAASGVTVDFATSDGSAAAGLDYSTATRTVTFNVNETTKTVAVPILNDCADETNETVLLSLSNPAGGGRLGTLTNAVLTITDNDTAGLISFSAASYSTNENAPAFRITVTRSGGTACGACVDYFTADGLALSNLDYVATSGTLCFGSNELSQTLTVGLLDDTLPEGDQTFLLCLTNPTGRAALGAISNATLRIRDDESSIAFTNSSYTVGEAGPTVTLNAVRSGPLTAAVSVKYSTVNGTAVSTNDYRGTNTATLALPANAGFQTITIPIVNDTVVEGDETFSVYLHDPQGGIQLGTLTNTTVTITDNDLGGVISFSATNFTVTEAGANATVTVSRSGGAASGVTVDFATSDGSAAAGLDYSTATRTVTFNANETTKTVAVPILNDCADETNETVFLSLSNPAGGARLGTLTNAILTITDNDTAGLISFSAATYTVSETNSVATITITRSGGTACDVSVDVATMDGSAEAYFDYEPKSETITFEANETTKTFTVEIYDDEDAEHDETVLLTLSNFGGGARPGNITNATLTIRDNEVAVVGLYKVSGSISVTACTDPSGNRNTGFVGDLELFDQFGTDFDGAALLINTTRAGFVQISLSGSVNAAGQIVGFYVTDFGGFGDFSGTVIGNNLQMSFAGDQSDETCHHAGTMSGAIYTPGTNGFAPSALEETSINAIISSGSGALPSSGSFDLLLHPDFDNYEISPLSAEVGYRSGVYVYTKTGSNTARITLADNFSETDEINEIVNLSFSSAGSGTYSATAISATGAQAGTFTVAQ